MVVNGTLSFSGSGAITVGGILQNAGTVNGSTSTLTFNSGGAYQHNFTTTAGTVPTATWNTGSTCAIIGYTTLDNSSGSPVIGGINQLFANFTWNCPNQTGTVTFIGDLDTVNGNLTITSTGTGLTRLGGTGTGNLTVSGNFYQTGGYFRITASRTEP